MNFQSFKFSAILACLCLNLSLTATVQAVYDPLSVSNNKIGIHIISADPKEASEAAQLVNNNGDWGYVTIIINDADRNINKWQTFFNDLRRRHLIPIVRIATHADGGNWVKPNPGEENSWAEFLNNLIWPTKNRYVIIFNEPNHGQEWGGNVDAASYAHNLDRFITALKGKSSDFFVLNAGLDASSPEQMPSYKDEGRFLVEMNQAVPGIFEKLDGWVSHSYPNPDFSGAVTDSGRGSIRTYQWEEQTLANLGVKKILPIFITETGWKHAEGIRDNFTYPSADRVAVNFQQAFSNVWNDPRIVAVTPFLLNYQDDPFEHFSFKKPDGQGQKIKLLSQNVLGAQYPEFYPQFAAISNLDKITGHPIQNSQAQLLSSNFSASIALNEQYNIEVKVKNTGQSIWGENNPVRLVPIQGGSDFNIEAVSLPDGSKIEPGQEYTFIIKIKSADLGAHSGVLALFNGDKQFDSPPFSFTSVTKSPVILVTRANLNWKKQSAGDYILSFLSGMTKTAQHILLGKLGQSDQFQIHNLLPDATYNFTLSRPYYYPKTISETVRSGVNTLDFGTLQPDIPSAILNPTQLWQILPFSN